MFNCCGALTAPSREPKEEEKKIVNFYVDKAAMKTLVKRSSGRLSISLSRGPDAVSHALHLDFRSISLTVVKKDLRSPLSM
jgi:hypothetical protein